MISSPRGKFWIFFVNSYWNIIKICLVGRNFWVIGQNVDIFKKKKSTKSAFWGKNHKILKKFKKQGKKCRKTTKIVLECCLDPICYIFCVYYIWNLPQSNRPKVLKNMVQFHTTKIFSHFLVAFFFWGGGQIQDF